MEQKYIALFLGVALAAIATGCSCDDGPDKAPLRPRPTTDAEVPQPDSSTNPMPDAGCTTCPTEESSGVTTEWLGDGDYDSFGVEEEDADDDGNPWLTLTKTQETDMGAGSVWISNANHGTVSRFDVNTGKELSRYASVLPGNGRRPWDSGCAYPNVVTGAGAYGNCPSRTALDQKYDAYVANRAFGGLGTVTKFANKLSDCVDRNNNMMIETSSDVDNNGFINMDQSLPDNQREFWGVDDECILWTVDVKGDDSVPRGIAIGKAERPGEVGDVWVGRHGTNAFFNPKNWGVTRIDAKTGDTTHISTAAGLRPYGAATGVDGLIYFSGGKFNAELTTRTPLGWVDPATNQFTLAPAVPGTLAPGCVRPYGIGTDAEGNIWLTNTGCQPELLYFSPSTQTWGGVDIPTVRRQGPMDSEVDGECLPVDVGGGVIRTLCTDGMGGGFTEDPAAGRGVAASFDSLFFAVSWTCAVQNPLELLFNTGCQFPENLVGQIDLSDKSFKRLFALPTVRGPVGVGYSPNSKLWVAGQDSNTVSFMDLDEDDEPDSAWTTVGIPTDYYDDNNNNSSRSAVVYTYSDFIGFGVNVLAAPNGFYRLVIEGCDDNEITKWKTLEFEAEKPNGTRVLFSMRTADEKSMLSQSLWVGPVEPTSPYDLTMTPEPLGEDGYLELEIVLETTDRTVRPRIRDLKVTYTCEPGPLN